MVSNEVAPIAQRMIFLRIYEILIEANQAIINRRDYVAGLAAVQYDAGYPFCYFTGEVLNDLLRQPIIWQNELLLVGDALLRVQPDLDRWLTPAIQQQKINDFFAWQPHTVRVQELVDDVKQRVLDVVDAVHAVEQLHAMEIVPTMLHMKLGDIKKRTIQTGGVTHSLTYCRRGEFFEPVLATAGRALDHQWHTHALIHGMWLVSQQQGYMRVEASANVPEEHVPGPIYLV